MNKRATWLVAGTALAVLSMIGVSPVGAFDDVPVAAAPAARQYCSGHDGYSVNRLYAAYFLRDPDPRGLAYWQNVLRYDETTLGGISQLFSTSPEFGSRYGTLSNRAFVELLYRNVMSREGEQGGVNYWTSVLDVGHQRGTVMLGFSDSAEFKERSGVVYPVPTATDLQKLYLADPFTVHPGGILADYRTDPTSKLFRYSFQPFPVSATEILRWTADELLCLGWTIRTNEFNEPSGDEPRSVIVSSENNLVVTANVWRQYGIIHPSYPTGASIELQLQFRFYDPRYDDWQPVTA